MMMRTTIMWLHVVVGGERCKLASWGAMLGAQQFLSMFPTNMSNS